ncbi:MAG TPA: DUF3015 family protein [Candidatus Krumholzibacteria bacterium]|nr:DUF3015 family protein [Candidatus Krumholzibacteria bacterium]
MKRFAVVTATVCLLFAGTAAANQSNTGCGIGTMIFEGKDGLLSQVAAVTTNGIFGNQTFGITSGTLECEQATMIVASAQVERFVGENMDQLAMDISRGQGEYVRTLAVLLDVPAEERTAFFVKLQANFTSIYPTDDVTHVDVIQNLETVLKG